MVQYSKLLIYKQHKYWVSKLQIRATDPFTD